MDTIHTKYLANFFVAGINYKKSDACVRGRFAINNQQYSTILERASLQGLNELFILSTCNRTEIYGFAASSRQLIDLLCSETIGDAESFSRSAYIKNGEEAVKHLFDVGAGLDSQILGDYEIVGQIKTAVRFAKENGFVASFTERLVNSVLQASKLIKNNTMLSGGTVSVSFAAVQYLKKVVADPASKKILLLGVGKIGRNTCLNMVDYLETRNITLMNRTAGKADQLVAELGVHSAPLEKLDREIRKADIIVVATNSTSPTILKEHIEGAGEKLIIDLSIPYNVHENARDLTNLTLVNVDELSKLKDETLKKRMAEVPKAEAIIHELMLEFIEWHEMRKHVPMLKDLKLKLRELYANPLFTYHSTTCGKKRDVQIQRVLNETAEQVKMKNERGCQYISALHQFISVKN